MQSSCEEETRNLKVGRESGEQFIKRTCCCHHYVSAQLVSSASALFAADLQCLLLAKSAKDHLPSGIFHPIEVHTTFSWLL